MSHAQKNESITNQTWVLRMKMPRIVGIQGLRWDWDAVGPNANLLQVEEGG